MSNSFQSGGKAHARPSRPYLFQLHKSGTTPRSKSAAVLHLPLLPDEIAAAVKQVCQEKEQCNVASF